MNGALHKSSMQNLTRSSNSTLILPVQIAMPSVLVISRRNKTGFYKIGGHSVFCNPPYSHIGEWIRKGWQESCKDGTTVVMLVPSRTDTRWFHQYVLHRAEVRFVTGRIKFGDSAYNAPFPSMVVIWRAGGITA